MRRKIFEWSVWIALVSGAALLYGISLNGIHHLTSVDKPVSAPVCQKDFVILQEYVYFLNIVQTNYVFTINIHTN
jgi:hypothetical protein